MSDTGANFHGLGSEPTLNVQKQSFFDTVIQFETFNDAVILSNRREQSARMRQREKKKVQERKNGKKGMRKSTHTQIKKKDTERLRAWAYPHRTGAYEFIIKRTHT